MHVLSPAELAALRVLCKRHERLSRRCGTEPNANAMSALDKLHALAGGFPARVASTGLRRLEIHDDDTRERLIVEFDRLHDRAIYPLRGRQASRDAVQTRREPMRPMRTVRTRGRWT